MHINNKRWPELFISKRNNGMLFIPFNYLPERYMIP